MLLFFEVDDAVGNVEIFAEAPFVAGAQNGGEQWLPGGRGCWRQ